MQSNVTTHIELLRTLKYLFQSALHLGPSQLILSKIKRKLKKIPIFFFQKPLPQSVKYLELSLEIILSGTKML